MFLSFFLFPVFLSAVRLLLVSHVTGDSLRLNLYDVGHYHREIFGSLQAHHIQVIGQNRVHFSPIMLEKKGSSSTYFQSQLPRVEARLELFRHATQNLDYHTKFQSTISDIIKRENVFTYNPLPSFPLQCNVYSRKRIFI